MDPHRSSARKALLGLATFSFILGIAFSVRSQPELLESLDWRPLLPLVLIGAPLSVALHAIDFMLSARLTQRRVTFFSACEIVVLGAAAGLLPVPGGTLVRIAGLKASGADLRNSALATMLLLAAGLAVALCYSGIAFGVLGSTRLGAAMAGIAFVLLGVSVTLSVRLLPGSTRPTLLFIFGNKILLSAVDAARILWSLQAFGVAATLPQSAAYLVAGAVGILIFVFPAGLGIQESLSAAIAPLIGQTASAGFLAASVNRLGLFVLIAPLAAWLSWRLRR